MWGDARIMRGRSHKVKRIRGLFSISGRKNKVIGAFMFSRGRDKNARKMVEFNV